MVNLRYLLGMIPDTSEIEAAEAALIKEYNDFIEYGESDELKTFQELDSFVNSGEFKEVKKLIESQKFKNTEEYNKLQKYKSLRRQKKFKWYYKVKNSQALKEFESVQESGLPEKYAELEAFVKSSAFEGQRESMSKKEFKRAIGGLYKKRLIEISDQGIRLKIQDRSTNP